MQVAGRSKYYEKKSINISSNVYDINIKHSNFAHPKQACNNAQQGNVTP